MTHDWMLRAPDLELSREGRQTAQRASFAKNTAYLTTDVPIWLVLDWLTRQGFLLHGSPHGNLDVLRVPEKDYGQPDAFSNRSGVYATSDALWAMMYALRGSAAIGQMDMCLRLETEEGWSDLRYFYALGKAFTVTDSSDELISPGWVYVLDPTGFEVSPPYEHGSLGRVQEMHWISVKDAHPVWAVPVRPADFPLPVRYYDVHEIAKRAQADPWGFPWLRA